MPLIGSSRQMGRTNNPSCIFEKRGQVRVTQCMCMCLLVHPSPPSPFAQHVCVCCRLCVCVCACWRVCISEVMCTCLCVLCMCGGEIMCGIKETKTSGSLCGGTQTLYHGRYGLFSRLQHGNICGRIISLHPYVQCHVCHCCGCD